ncbi:MAG: hypothetical protein V4481_01915 [Patescibacteria group bacterium]
MSIASKIEHLRTKPEHVRRRIAFWSSLGTSAIIFAFWLASFTSVSSNTQGAIAQAVNNVETPSQSLVASVGDFFDGIRDMIFTPKKIEYKSVEVRPGNK